MGNSETRTYSIENEIFDKFYNICKAKKLNRSKIIQGCIKNFIIDNFEIDNKQFLLKLDENNYNPVTVTKRENEMFHLSDGNILNFFTFEKMYEEVDPAVKNVLEQIEGLKKHENTKLDDIFKDDKSLKETDKNLNGLLDADKVLETITEYEEKIDELREISNKSFEDIILNEEEFGKNNMEIEIGDDIMSPDFLKQCNINPEIATDFVDKIKKQDKNGELKFPDLDDFQPSISYNFDITDSDKIIIKEKLKSFDFDANAYDITNIFRLDGLEIFIFDFNLVIYYNETKIKFDKINLIKLINEIIKDIEDVVNIKIIPYDGKEIYIKDYSLIPITEDRGNHIKNVETDIKNSFKLKEFSIIDLYSQMTNTSKIQIISTPVLFKNHKFHEIIEKYFPGEKIMFDFERYKSVQNDPIDYNEKRDEIKALYGESNNLIMSKNYIEELTKLNDEYGVIQTFQQAI